MKVYLYNGLKFHEGMFFACSQFIPHPVVQSLAKEARTRKVLYYQGRRFIGWPSDALWNTQKWMPAAVYYYNTPHISMGSVHSDGWIHQCRYNSILFGADPSLALRVETSAWLPPQEYDTKHADVSSSTKTGYWVREHCLKTVVQSRNESESGTSIRSVKASAHTSLWTRITMSCKCLTSTHFPVTKSSST